MADSKELKKIKKIYGEQFMHLCRSLFPTILEKEGLLLEILESSFSNNSPTLFQDIIDNGLEDSFKDYIYSKVDVEKEEMEAIKQKTPYELLEEAGYDLYECHTEEEIQKFKKYYAENEELCTFRGGRLDRCVVFWAIRKDAEELRREDFTEPKREDEYGTSVMGIQFSKIGKCTVSIKNRYNHSVNNPDATYGNDLDKIIPGLTQSFKELLSERGLELDAQNVEKFEIPGYTVASDGKYYRYNMEVNGIYYCPGNVIIDNGKVIKLDPEKQMLIDYFIIDRTKKTITLYDSTIGDSFTKGHEDIKKIEMINEKDEKGKKTDNRIIKIYKDKTEPIEIKIDGNNQIIGYRNEEITEIEHYFLLYNRELRKLSLPNVTRIGHHFLFSNIKLTELDLPKVTKIMDYGLTDNQGLTKLSLPNVIDIGDDFLSYNQELAQLDLPKVTQIGNGSLYANRGLTELYLPNVELIGYKVLCCNNGLKKLNLPNVRHIFANVLTDNMALTELSLPKVTDIGDYFLSNNRKLTEVNLPNVVNIGHGFLSENKVLTKLSLPNVKHIWRRFLSKGGALEKLSLPNVVEIGDSFFEESQLRILNLPKVERIGSNCLKHNTRLRRLSLPKVKEIGTDFLKFNPEVSLKIPSKSPKKISSADIAELDKEEGLTTTEISKSKRIIENIRSFFINMTKGKERKGEIIWSAKDV